MSQHLDARVILALVLALLAAMYNCVQTRRAARSARGAYEEAACPARSLDRDLRRLRSRPWTELQDPVSSELGSRVVFEPPIDMGSAESELT